MVGVSVLIISYNSEKVIEECLKSVEWADEILLVDAFSLDETVSIARRYTEKIFQREFTNFGEQRNWALQNIPWQSDWILVVDTDERVTPELREEILRVTHDKLAPYDGYWINRKTFAFGKWIRHGGWYPNYNLRLFKKGQGLYGQSRVHEELELSGRAGYLKNDLVHESYRSISEYLDRMNFYSALEAADIAEGRKPKVEWPSFPRLKFFKSFFKWLYFVLPGKSLMTFLWMYVFRLGFLDGVQGFLIAVLSALNAFVTYAKVRELRQTEKASKKAEL